MQLLYGDLILLSHGVCSVLHEDELYFSILQNDKYILSTGRAYGTNENSNSGSSGIMGIL